MKDDKTILTTSTYEGHTQRISIYFRDGQFYWTIKSCAFPTMEKAFRDVNSFCDVNRVFNK